MNKIKIHPLREDFIMPVKASKGSAAYDIILQDDTELSYGRQIIKTGFRLEMPKNICADVRSRSGYSAKGLKMYNKQGEEERVEADVLLGLIDSDYRGEIGVILNVRDPRVVSRRLTLKKGDAVAQISFREVPQTELVCVGSLSVTERGDKGFGGMNNE